MNLKTKIFTLIVAGLLIVPVLFNPPKANSVLGVSEKTTESSPTKTTSAQSTPSSASTSGSQTQSTATPKTANTTPPASTSSSSTPSTNSNNSASASTNQATQSSSAPAQSEPSNKTESKTTNSNNSLLPNIGLPKINLNLGGIFSRDNTNTNQPKPRNFAIKDITSGVREKIDTEPSILSDNNPEARGYIQWESSATTSIVSNKYQLGASVQVNTSNQSGVDLVISKVQALPVDTILVVDQNTFIKLGGNPQTQKEILGTISKTN